MPLMLCIMYMMDPLTDARNKLKTNFLFSLQFARHIQYYVKKKNRRNEKRTIYYYF